MGTLPEPLHAASRKSLLSRLREQWLELPPGQRSRLRGLFIFGAAVILAFSWPLVSLITYTLGEELHSHIVLIPLVSAWVLNLKARQLPRDYQTSAAWGSAFLLAGLAALIADWRLQSGGPVLSLNDHLALLTFSFLCILACGAFLFLGRRWMAAAAFPVALLLFMIPLPDRAVEVLESASQAGSTDAAELIFHVTGIPYLREGSVFYLPGTMPIQVARECSGIRSSWVLFITCLLASHLFLQTTWRRIVLVALIIPLGLIRNGFRVVTIAWLCMEFGQHMIDSFIHHRGGPIFFALSLIPLTLLIWWLRRSERRAARRKAIPKPIIQL